MIAQTIEVTVTPSKGVPPQFDEFFERAADAFYDCEGVFDQDLSGDASDGTITFSMGVSDADLEGGFATAMAAVRTAMHAAGAGTPGWESHINVAMNALKGSEADLLASA